MEDMTLEDLAMNGSNIECKAKKAERKRLRRLENVKRDLNMDNAYNDEDLTAVDVEEGLMRTLKGLKDPVVKATLGAKAYKGSVNCLINAINCIAAVKAKETNDLLKPI